MQAAAWPAVPDLPVAGAAGCAGSAVNAHSVRLCNASAGAMRRMPCQYCVVCQPTGSAMRRACPPYVLRAATLERTMRMPYPTQAHPTPRGNILHLRCSAGCSCVCVWITYSSPPANRCLTGSYVRERSKRTPNHCLMGKSLDERIVNCRMHHHGRRPSSAPFKSHRQPPSA
jgi:hypothetical protein